MTSSDIFDAPRTLTMNGVRFLESDVAELQALFPTLDMLTATKEEIRMNATIQKAILSGAAACNSISQDDNVVLNLTQAGRALLGKI